MRRVRLAHTGVPQIPAADDAGDDGSSVGAYFEGRRTEWEENRDTTGIGVRVVGERESGRNSFWDQECNVC